MRFIHTADWHLGNSLFNIDRTKEFEEFLGWLKDELVKTEADALVIAGDVFDVVNPPVTSRKQYNKFLASLLNTKCRNVIIVGGNHDSGALLDSEKEILDVLNIHVVGSLNNISLENLGDIVYEIKDENDQVTGLCCAIPFAREIELRNYFKDKVGQGELSDYAYQNLYNHIKMAAEKKNKGKNVPVIATGHLYAAGLEGRFENAEKEIRCDDGRRTIDDVIGNLGSVHVSVFPEEFSYIALGHIHYTTMVAKNPKVRYSGSPFVLGFDEANLPRYVLLVEVETGKETKVEKIEVPRFFEYKRISGTIEEIKNELKEIKTASVPTFLELYYKREEGLSVYDELYETIGNLPKGVYVVNKKPQIFSQVNNSYSDIENDEIKNLSAEDIFKSLILNKSEIDTTGLSEKEIEKKKKELIKKYLPLFMEVAEEVESGAEEASLEKLFANEFEEADSGQEISEEVKSGEKKSSGKKSGDDNENS